MKEVIEAKICITYLIYIINLNKERKEILMNLKPTKLVMLLSLLILIPLISGCFTILSVLQPGAVTPNTGFSVHLKVRTEDQEANPKYGIVGLLIPNDFTVNRVHFSGDIGTDECSFLPADTPDSNPGNVDFWTDSLEARYPSGDDMQWVVYQSDNPHTSNLDSGYVDLHVEMTSGTVPW